MLGYIKPVKPELKVKEWEAYQGIYCGLCKQLGRKYGQISRMTLSYDFVFLALLSLGLEEKEIAFCRQTCMVHPFKKRTCCKERESLDYSCTVAVILLYHKLLDNLADGKFWEKLAVRLALPFAKRGYRKATGEEPELAKLIEGQMENQRLLEAEGSASVDEACEPTAACMAAILSGLSQEPGKKRVLERMGYLLGRWVYLIDALDDYKDDVANGNYNPFARANKSEPTAEAEAAREAALHSLYLTTAEIGKAYELLGISSLDTILENIIYDGLLEAVDRVKE